jgi:hypothetical protein
MPTISTIRAVREIDGYEDSGCPGQHTDHSCAFRAFIIDRRAVANAPTITAMAMTGEVSFYTSAMTNNVEKMGAFTVAISV